MKKIFYLLVLFCFLSQTDNSIYPCSIIYISPIKFDSTEYIFIGKIIGYTGSLYSDSLQRRFQGLIVEVIDPVYMPDRIYTKFKIVPYVLGAACELTTWDEKSFKQKYPLGIELRIVGKKSVFIKNDIESDIIILDISPRNMFWLSENFKEPAILFSTKSSIYDYRYFSEDSLKSFKNFLSLNNINNQDDLQSSFWQQFNFELRKDLYRLSVVSSDVDKAEIIKRLFSFSSYSKKDFLEIINGNINSDVIKQELILQMPKRFESPAADTMFHSEIPASLSSHWIQTNGPYGGTITGLTLKVNSDQSLTLFAGTRTNGVFRSTNSGKNWAAVNTGLTNPYIYTVFTNGNDIYAGTDSGAFRSTNNGENWIAINNGFEIKKVFRVFVFAATERYLFIGTNGSGIFRSSDNGESWSAVNSGLSNINVNCLLSYNEYLFAGTFGGIFVSTDNGDNWRAINEGLPNSQYQYLKSLRLYVNTILMSGDKLFIGTEEDGLYSSTDFGKTWKSVNLDLESVRVNLITGIPENLFVCTRKGIFRSTNNGEEWIPVNEKFSEHSQVSLVISKRSFGHSTKLFAVTAKGVYYSTNNGEKWESINTGLRNTNVNELTVSGKNLIAGIYNKGIFLFNDNDQTWSSISEDLSGNRFRTVVSDEKNIFVENSDGIFHSTNNGENWLQILENKNVRKIFLVGNKLFVSVDNNLVSSTDFGKSWDTCITRASVKLIEKSGDDLFLIKHNETLRSADDGLSWTVINTGEDCFVSSFVADVGKLYAVAGKCGVIFSSDNGNNWISYDNDFKYYGFNNLTVYGKYLFAISDKLGVFISMNEGQDWIPFNFGLKDLWVLSLIVKNNTLYAGTTTGVWAHKLNH